MKKPNTIEDEIDRIRLEIYEETKDMTSAELTAYYRQGTEATMKKFGLKFKVAENARPSNATVRETATATMG